MTLVSRVQGVDDAGSAPGPVSGDRGGRGPVLRAAAVVLVATFGVVAYDFLYQLTKPSPVSIAPVGDVVVVAAYAVLLSVLLTVLLLPLVVVVNLVGSRLRPNSTGLGTVLGAGAVLAVGLLVFTENLVYSSQGVGLKTDDGVLIKLLFGVFAVSLGVLGALRLAKLRDRSVRVVAVATSVLVAVSVVVVGVYLRDQQHPAPLEAVGPSRLVNVVILSADGIDANRMSVYGYGRETTPFLDAKAEEFQVFENAFTNNGNTTGSIAALLSGAAPSETGVIYPPDALQGDDARRTLPYLLGELGYYRSNWAVPHYAEGRDQNLVDAFDEDNGYRPDASPVSRLPLGAGAARWFVHDVVEGSAGVAADVLGIRELTNPYSQVSHIVGDTLSDEDRLSAVLEEIEDHSRLFTNTHFMVTHGPVFTLDDPVFSRGAEQAEPWERDFYDDSLRQFDSYVQAVYEQLEDTGKLDDTLFIVTSDHGIRYDATKRVPLLIRFPGAAPAGRVDTNVQRLDVAPTVLDVMGFEAPDWMTGQSLLDPSQLDPEREIVATTTATRVFPNHLGFRPRDGEVLVTTIRCNTYVTEQPSGEADRGRVVGSTARCP